jgi:hypothetical protein
MVEQRKRLIRRSSGRFFGFRINCEQVPTLPAWAVRLFLADPRKIPYLLVWKSSWDGTVKDTVRLSREASREAPLAWTGWIEIRRIDGTCTYIRPFERPLPRNNGQDRLLLCPRCHTPRRALYGIRVGDDGRYYVVRRADWICRTCAGLRYSSEGGYLRPSGLGRLEQLGVMLRTFGNLPRPESWLPYVFTSLDAAAAELGIEAARQ